MRRALLLSRRPNPRAALDLLHDHDEVVVGMLTGGQDLHFPAHLLGVQQALPPGAWATPVLTARWGQPPLGPDALARLLPSRLPEAQTWVTDDTALQAAIQHTGRRCDAAEPGPDLRAPDTLRRLLLVARAQPWHNGHQALAALALAEVDELVVVVACAERSHRAQDPYTAGERLGLIRAALPERALLVAVPHPDEDAVGLTWLQLLGPRVEGVVGHNPALRALAESADLPVYGLPNPPPVSGQRVRARLAAGHPIADLVPEAVDRALREPLRARVALLHAPEPR